MLYIFIYFAVGIVMLMYVLDKNKKCNNKFGLEEDVNTLMNFNPMLRFVILVAFIMLMPIAAVYGYCKKIQHYFTKKSS